MCSCVMCKKDCSGCAVCVRSVVDGVGVCERKDDDGSEGSDSECEIHGERESVGEERLEILLR